MTGRFRNHSGEFPRPVRPNGNCGRAEGQTDFFRVADPAPDQAKPHARRGGPSRRPQALSAARIPVARGALAAVVATPSAADVLEHFAPPRLKILQLPWGISGTNTTSSGSWLGFGKEVQQVAAFRIAAFLLDDIASISDAATRSAPPLGGIGMRHHRVFDVDRADPFAAGFDEHLPCCGGRSGRPPSRSITTTSPVLNQPSPSSAALVAGSCL